MKKTIKENAAAGSVSAGNVAGTRGLLFTGIRQLSRTRSTVAGIPVIKFKNESNMNTRIKSIKDLPESAQTSFKSFLAEEIQDDQFDPSEVIAKLSKNADIADDLEGDELAVFGMESDDGSVTKVYVPAEQGKEFEQALGDALQNNKDTNEEEIASILFDLKDKFKIVDVVWPTIQEDEEEDPATAGPADMAPGAPGEDPAAGPEGEMPAGPEGEMGADPAAAPGPEGEMPAGPEGDMGAMDAPAEAPADPSSMITQILDMLRADAEARKADAAAKTAEAKAKEAESAAKIAAIKIQGEEGILDAEAHFDQQKEEKKEADRIKMLAKFRQETKLSGSTVDSAPSMSDTTQADLPPAAPAEAPADAAPAGPATPPAPPAKSPQDEEEERITFARKHLLSILNRGY